MPINFNKYLANPNAAQAAPPPVAQTQAPAAPQVAPPTVNPLEEVFGRVSKVDKLYTNGSYMNYGRYRLRVQVIKGHKGDKGSYAILEGKVLRSENLPSFPTRPDTGVPYPAELANRPGEVVSYSENVDNIKKGGASRFQSALATLFGMDRPLNYGQLLFVAGPKAPATFLDIDVEVKPKWIEPKGNHKEGIFLKNYRWTAVELTEAEVNEVHAQRAAANLAPLGDALNELISIP